MKNQKEFCLCSEQKESHRITEFLGFKYKENNLEEAEQPEWNKPFSNRTKSFCLELLIFYFIKASEQQKTSIWVCDTGTRYWVRNA